MYEIKHNKIFSNQKKRRKEKRELERGQTTTIYSHKSITRKLKQKPSKYLETKKLNVI